MLTHTPAGRQAADYVSGYEHPAPGYEAARRAHYLRGVPSLKAYTDEDDKPDITPPSPPTPNKSRKAPRGHFHIHDPNKDPKTSHEYPAPGETSFNEHQMPLARRAPNQFVHVHVNNTTGAEVAVNAWMAVPQPAYV